ncbi:MAG: hypothetical protein QXS19_07030 [Candidatus Methanomethylicia archaeon]
MNSNIFTSLYWYDKVRNSVRYVYNNISSYKSREQFVIPNLYYKNLYRSIYSSIYVIEAVKRDLYSILINFNMFKYVFNFLRFLRTKNNFMYYSNYLGKYRCELLGFLDLFVHGENVRRKSNLSLSKGFLNIYNSFSFNMYNRFSEMYNLDGDNLKDLFIKRQILYQIKNDFGKENNNNIKQNFELMLNLLQVIQDKYMDDIDISKYMKYFNENDSNKANLVVSSTLFYNTGNILIYIDLKLRTKVSTYELITSDILFLSFVLTPHEDFYCYRDIDGFSRRSFVDEDIRRIKKEILGTSLFLKKRYSKINLK